MWLYAEKPKPQNPNKERDKLIAITVLQGATLQIVARTHGLTGPAVRQITKKMIAAVDPELVEQEHYDVRPSMVVKAPIGKMRKQGKRLIKLIKDL